MPPEDVRCAALTSQSLQVSWQPPSTEYCNGLLMGYKLTYEPVLDDIWRSEFLKNKHLCDQFSESDYFHIIFALKLHPFCCKNEVVSNNYNKLANHR